MLETAQKVKLCVVTDVFLMIHAKASTSKVLMMISLCLFSVFTDFTTAGSSCSLVSSLNNNTEKDGITNNLYVKRWSTPIKEPEVEPFLLPCFTIHSITLLRETKIFHQAMTMSM